MAKNRMTEAEWDASSDPYQMLRRCRRVIRYNPRKGRLFAVACCRRIWHLLDDPRSRAAVEVAARFADGQASAEQLHEAERAAGAAHADAFEVKGKRGACGEWAAQFAAAADAWHAASRASNFAYVTAGDGLQPGPEHAAQAQLLRCVFGPLPFRRVTVDPSWLAWGDATAVKLAQAVYEDCAFDRLPILADALEDAGCADADVLGHLRGPGPHVRGCWALDLLLGKG
jgi:hypothetical protein